MKLHLIGNAAGLATLFWAASATGAAAQQTWAVSPTPVTDVRAIAESGDVLFERAVGAARLSDGRLVIADALAGTLRLFDSRGRPLTTVGRSGGGPGEYRSMWWMGQCGRDTVVAWDRGLARLTTVGGDAAAATHSPIPVAREVGPGVLAATCSRGGVFASLIRPADLRPGADGISRGPSTIVLSDGTRELATLKDAVTSSELIVRGGGGMPRPLGRQTSVAVGADRIYVGTADSAVIDVHALDGRRIGTLRLDVAERRVTDSDYERALDHLLAQVPPQAHERVRQMLADIPRPDRHPPYSGLFVDPAGTLWVLLSSPSDERTHLRAVDARGRSLGDVRLPRAIDVWEVGTDYVLGHYTDADDEPHVVVYGFRR